ncbi:hypothetical protein BDP27DRAFT_1435521 [Rhodocollybia butyracea]|uniref:Mid2 domain-containing protein n=1 Tax=Rhodocollybia butyracea TaxID=206335 RepID=A0A9P5P4H4_9AGAR|nr:hypothetical protein BDP27DRAFT_1435521 [Rhodocollybia butyracea]
MFDFVGTALYIFFILVNNVQSDVFSGIFSDIVTTTAANFTLDGVLVGTFTHLPDSTLPDFQFGPNALVFSTSGLKNAAHQMVISTSDLTESFFVNFDYALYTFENAARTESMVSESWQLSTFPTSTDSSSPSTSTTNINHLSVGASVGGIIGGLAVLIGVLVVLFCHRRRQHFRPRSLKNINSELKHPLVPNTSALVSTAFPYLNYSNSNLPLATAEGEPWHSCQNELDGQV